MGKIAIDEERPPVILFLSISLPLNGIKIEVGK